MLESINAIIFASRSIYDSSAIYTGKWVSELYALKQVRVDRIFIASRAAFAPCEIDGFGRYISHCLICIQVLDHS